MRFKSPRLHKSIHLKAKGKKEERKNERKKGRKKKRELFDMLCTFVFEILPSMQIKVD